MEGKSSKPLIIITAALSLAVITLSVQVVFLTFTVKDQKSVEQLQCLHGQEQDEQPAKQPGRHLARARAVKLGLQPHAR